MDEIRSDPRTWTDFRDPAARGFVKIDCDTPFESGLLMMAVFFGLLAGLLFLESLHPDQRGLLTLLLGPSGIPAGPVMVSLAIASGTACALWLATDNYYLVDPAQHVVYSHFNMFFVRRVRRLLERPDILAITAQARPRRTRYGRSWWEQRAVIVTKRGRVVPITNWRRDALWDSNNTALELAKELDCQAHPAPEDSRLVVRSDHGVATIEFVSFNGITRLDPYYWGWIGVGLVIALMALASGWIR